MLLKYGTYAHAASECAVARTQSSTFNGANQLLSVVRRWAISGQLHGADSTATKAARVALLNAYAIPYKDLVLYEDDGSTVNDSLLNRGSTSGVRVVSGPDFPVGQGAEGGTFLSYAIVLEATYEFNTAGDSAQSNDSSRLESWTETITVTGGGPRYGLVEVVDGPPVRQLLNGQTKMRVTQSGRAVGRKNYPSAPGPIFPDSENPAERAISQTSPEGQGTGFQTTWNYVMEGASISGGVPNSWPL